MARSRFGRWTLLAGLVLALAACEEGAGRQDAGDATGQGGGPRFTGRDIEAPEVFEANEDGLWDGRPSLGGVWVAHPTVTNPQRVMILNKSNGETIVGALFRRERENPGPRIQISSDAAVELGILAGQPTPLRVVALKREEAPEPVPPAEGEATVAEEADATETPETDAEGLAAAAETAIGTASDAPEVEPVPEDAPPTSFGRRRPRPAPADAAEAAAAAEDETELPAADAAAAAPEATPEAAPLDATAAEPVPEDRPPTSFGPRRPRRSAPDAAAPGAAEDITVAPLEGAQPETAAEAPPAGGLELPYIQAAIFGTEANANTAAEGLRDAGLSVTVRKTTSNGTEYWRVLVGPASSAAERDAMLDQAKALGYRDAYPVRG
jgi:cell division septation protein DedD